MEETGNNGTGDADDYVTMCNDGRNRGRVWQLAADITGQPAIRDREVEEFWEVRLGEDGYAPIQEPAFARGWIEGALGVWEAVQNEL